ncbi:MAG: PaaI family thioesterase [Leptospiraceae bacterium]|nr:PaaI family thioesterase [Leptospiraceae bacterium]
MEYGKNSALIELIDQNCPDWIQRPDPDWDKIRILQSIIDQVLPGLLNIRIQALDDKKIIGVIPFARSTANVVGYMHGGTIYSLGDTLAGAFLWSKSDGSHIAITRKSVIRYLRPLQSGNLKCTVTETSRNGRKIFLRADYISESGQKISEVEMEYIQVTSKTQDSNIQ